MMMSSSAAATTPAYQNQVSGDLWGWSASGCPIQTDYTYSDQQNCFNPKQHLNAAQCTLTRSDPAVSTWASWAAHGECAARGGWKNNKRVVKGKPRGGSRQQPQQPRWQPTRNRAARDIPLAPFSAAIGNHAGIPPPIPTVGNPGEEMRVDRADGRLRTKEEFMFKYAIGADFSVGERLWEEADEAHCADVIADCAGVICPREKQPGDSLAAAPPQPAPQQSVLFLNPQAEQTAAGGLPSIDDIPPLIPQYEEDDLPELEEADEEAESPYGSEQGVSATYSGTSSGPLSAGDDDDVLAMLPHDVGDCTVP